MMEFDGESDKSLKIFVIQKIKFGGNLLKFNLPC